MLFYTEESYKADYHRAIEEFLKTYLESGDFEKEIDAMTELLLPYVEKDPTALKKHE